MMRGMMVGAIAVAAAAWTTIPIAALAAPASAIVTRVDDGYLMGRPSAPLRIVVASSFGCPHCRVLDITMMDPLKKEWIDTGKASLRFVPYVLFTPDIPTVIIADCGPASGYFTRASALFSVQRGVTQSFFASPLAKSSVAAGDFAKQDIRAIAKATDMVSRAAAAGVSPAEAARCLGNPKASAVLASRQRLAKQRYGVAGTPDVTLNGRDLGTGGSWPALESALRTAAKASGI